MPGLRRLAPALLAGGLAACGAPASPPLDRIPLAAFADSLRTVVGTVAVDPGDPAARPRLREGWGPIEQANGTAFAWAAGPQSRLAFDLVTVRDLEVRLRGWSFPFAGGGEQRVAAWVNGVPVGQADVAPTATEFRFAVAASALAAGENLLELRYTRWNDVDGERPWAVAWDRVRIVAVAAGGRNSPEPPKPPRIDAANGSLELPAGTAVEAAFELAAGSRLAWETVATTGDARLTLAVTTEAEPTRERPLIGAGEEVLLGPLRPAGLASFALRVAGTNGAVRLGGVHLRRPVEGPTSPPAVATLADGKRPNLIVYLVDTLRADHLGCYGYALPTSPRIDRFAAESVLFQHGRAQSSWTKPAVASILTGLFPVAHGAELRSERIHESVETLAERLQALGYETVLFTTNANITARFGFAQGWDSFRLLKHRKGGKREHYDAAEMNREIFAWLDERARQEPQRPFFLFVHTLDPHDPYRPREEFRQRFAAAVDVEAVCCSRSNQLVGLSGEAAQRRAVDAMALYDAEIAQNDAAFGDLLDELERRGLTASSTVLLTADHGEEFFDHGGWKHGLTLYEEMLRIPFILRFPGGRSAGRKILQAVDQIDIAPTLLALAGAPPAPGLPGRDLARLLEASSGGPFPGPLPASFSWLARPGVRMFSAVGGASKLVGRGGEAFLHEPRRELFDLATDPGERSNLADSGRSPSARERWLEGAHRAALARHGGREPAEEAEIDPELERSLRALGYF